MKYIKLNAPRVIAGINRHPAEGPLPFDDDVVDGIVADKAGVEVDEDGEEVDEDGEEVEPNDDDDADGLDKKNMHDLTMIVTEEGVPLNGATKKADVIAAIRLHRNPAPAE